MNSFSEKHKSAETETLLLILSEENKYHPDAIISAKNELANRNLDITEYLQAENNLTIQLEKAARPSKRVDTVNTKLKQLFVRIIDWFKPNKKAVGKTEGIITIITVVYALIFTAKIIFNIQAFILGIEFYIPEALFYIICNPLNSIYISAAILLFWFRKKSGWILLSAYILHQSILVTTLFIDSFSWGPPWHSAENLIEQKISLYISYLSHLATVYFLFNKKLRTHYSLVSKDIIIAIVLIFVYSLIA